METSISAVGELKESSDDDTNELSKKKFTKGVVQAAATDDKRGTESSVVLVSRAFRTAVRSREYRVVCEAVEMWALK